jgi:hypothetical protein
MLGLTTVAIPVRVGRGAQFWGSSVGMLKTMFFITATIRHRKSAFCALKTRFKNHLMEHKDSPEKAIETASQLKDSHVPTKGVPTKESKINPPAASVAAPPPAQDHCSQTTCTA